MPKTKSYSLQSKVALVGEERAISIKILQCKYLIPFMPQSVHCGRRSDSVIPGGRDDDATSLKKKSEGQS